MERSIAFYENTMGFTKAFSIKRPETGEPWIEYIYAGGDQFIELFYGGTNEILYSYENKGRYTL